MEGMELIAFQIISAAGTARSMFVEALNLAKEGKTDEARQIISEGEECFTQGHKAHAELLSKSADGETIVMDLLMVHAEDQMMSAETYRMFAEELISLYEKLNSK